jgi:hypothetical protein
LRRKETLMRQYKLFFNMKWLVLLLAVIFVLGCTGSQEKSTKQIAEENCISLCKQTNANLSNGPCLSDRIVEDWVCDVAHSPRTAVDNISENQCAAFKNGSAHHFVEVDEECNLIMSV